MNLTNTEESRLLELSVANTELALLTALGDDTTAGTELTGGLYERRMVTFAAPTSDGISNQTSVLFLDLPAHYSVGWELWSTDGAERRWFGYWDPATPTWSADVFTFEDHGFEDDDMVIFPIAPGALAAGTPYFVRDATADTFKVAANPGDPAEAVAGTGTTTVARVLYVPEGDTFEIKPGQLTLAMD